MASVEPLAVSPFIKSDSACSYGVSMYMSLLPFPTCSWTLLGAGIFYGYSRYHYLSRVQKARRDEWERQRPAREAKQKAEKEAAVAAELATLSAELGVKFP